MRYFFYNTYGDANELILSSPSDVSCVPFGWTPEIEETRNEIIQTLQFSPSCLPSVVFLHPGKTLTDTQGQEIIFDAYWTEIRVADLPKPWTWDDIDAQIQIKLQE